jgi:hypothetical protein
VGAAVGEGAGVLGSGWAMSVVRLAAVAWGVALAALW